ncbi:hypothetical protein N3553_13145 [Pantoea dispersa]|uniref:hypothetical protein n=1 Tax=Pantoea dispersa TaxID=59814 RepID=UPI0021AFC368|nr:hypothetical protein [Pantoea dispersa]MCT6590822.1 hypothetical protein [Pantoea dispersa]
MYKILFIDEEKEAIEDFKDYVDETPTSKNIEVLNEYPLKEIDEMISLIIKLNPDAIITDFMLNEHKTDIKYGVSYNGIELVKRIMAIREGFPCFVMTSFDDDAVKQSDDVNLVYIKDILHSEKDTKVKANFLEKVVNQISHYQSKIHSVEVELKKLIKLRDTGKAGIVDEERIIELDTFLERAIDKKSTIPKEYKKLSNTQRLESILNKVDNILSKVNKK